MKSRQKSEVVRHTAQCICAAAAAAPLHSRLKGSLTCESLGNRECASNGVFSFLLAESLQRTRQKGQTADPFARKRNPSPYAWSISRPGFSRHGRPADKKQLSQAKKKVSVLDAFAYRVPSTSASARRESPRTPQCASHHLPSRQEDILRVSWHTRLGGMKSRLGLVRCAPTPPDD